MILKKIYHKIWDLAQKGDDAENKKTKQDMSGSVETVENIQYGADKTDNVFDVSYPKNTTKKLPAIFVLHGGGYVGGKKENTKQYTKQLASRGFCVFNLEFCRCDNKDKKYFIDQVADFYDFYDYIKSDEKLCEMIDFDNIFLSGDSAGGHLAEIIASIQSNKLLDKNLSFLNGPKIKGLILVSPVFGPFKMLNAPLQPLLKPIAYGKEQNKKLLGNKNHGFDVLSKDFPPVIMFSAKNDFLTKEHKKLFIKKAKEIGIDLEHYTITKAHKLFHSSMIKYCDHYQNCLNKVAQFVNWLSKNKKKKGVFEYSIEEEIKSKKPAESKEKQL